MRYNPLFKYVMRYFNEIFTDILGIGKNENTDLKTVKKAHWDVLLPRPICFPALIQSHKISASELVIC